MKPAIGIPGYSDAVAVFLECKSFKEGGIHIARCERLRLSDQGETEEQARENLQSTLWLFFKTCVERGTLFKVLDERGVQYARMSPGGGSQNHSAQKGIYMRDGQVLAWIPGVAEGMDAHRAAH